MAEARWEGGTVRATMSTTALGATPWPAPTTNLGDCSTCTIGLQSREHLVWVTCRQQRPPPRWGQRPGQRQQQTWGIAAHVQLGFSQENTWYGLHVDNNVHHRAGGNALARAHDEAVVMNKEVRFSPCECRCTSTNAYPSWVMRRRRGGQPGGIFKPDAGALEGVGEHGCCYPATQSCAAAIPSLCETDRRAKLPTV